MAASKTSPAPDSADREVVITRVLDAKRDLVFKAWTEPNHLARWWGPHGFTNPVCELDVRPGGAIRIDMRGPDGTVYPMTGVFREIIEPERLMFTASSLDDEGCPLFEVLNTVTFAERAGKTTVRVLARVVMTTPEVAPYLEGMEPGWAQSLERLADQLASMQGTARERTTSRTRAVATVADREIVVSRVFEAPRELVWEAWTDPVQVVCWWGPRGFKTTIETMEVRPGGVWKHVMHGPDGTDYPNKSVFIEVVKPERIVYSHGGGTKGRRGVNFEATWTFEALNRHQTRVTMRGVFPSAEDRERVVKEYGAIEGGKQTLERLGEHLQATAGSAPAASQGRDFVITRAFDAPRGLVWKAWTESEPLKHWWGPKGFTMLSLKLDLRPGGVFHYCMRAPNGSEMWGKFVYREIVAPELLVFIVSFADEKGISTRHPLSPTWPLEVLNTLTFSEQEGRTTLTVQAVPINATESERKTFEAGRKSMQQGFTGTLDQLAAYLASEPGK
jgi:uncharacterized protein YndB with AHSA1/START domain